MSEDLGFDDAQYQVWLRNLQEQNTECGANQSLIKWLLTLFYIPYSKTKPQLYYQRF